MTKIKRLIHFTFAVALAMVVLPCRSFSQAPTNLTPVPGTIQSLTDDAMTVQTDKGIVSIRIVRPLVIYASGPSNLAHVKPNSFVGITSVKQPDGTELASEIHVIAEELRGVGEGSYMMGTVDKAGNANRMTNGAVSDSRMTNGSVEPSKSSSALTIKFQGGTQTITIPPDVPVTEIARTHRTLSPGAKVYVLAIKQDDGTFTTSKAVLRDDPSK